MAAMPIEAILRGYCCEVAEILTILYAAHAFAATINRDDNHIFGRARSLKCRVGAKGGWLVHRV
jgi:hypothetical protein